MSEVAIKWVIFWVSVSSLQLELRMLYFGHGWCVWPSCAEHDICVRLFCDAVANFQTGQEEISLIATPLKLTIKNYVGDEPGW